MIGLTGNQHRPPAKVSHRLGRRHQLERKGEIAVIKDIGEEADQALERQGHEGTNDAGGNGQGG
jgi:hypothetical protein